MVANLTNADLTETNLEEAYLTEANLTGVKLREDDLTGAKRRLNSGSRKWYLSGLQLRSKFSGCPNWLYSY